MESRAELRNGLEKLEKAFNKLAEAVKLEPDEFIRDSVIKRFEFTFGLLWKTIQKLAKEEVLECYSPKSCFKIAYKMGLINNEEVFLSMLEYRSLTVHTYNEYDAEKVYSFVKDKGVDAFEDIISKLRNKIEETYL